MLGPIGVVPDRQDRGTGSALLRRALEAMPDDGHAYAIIGWAGPVDWYAREVGATIITNSEPGRFERHSLLTSSTPCVPVSWVGCLFLSGLTIV